MDIAERVALRFTRLAKKLPEYADFIFGMNRCESSNFTKI